MNELKRFRVDLETAVDDVLAAATKDVVAAVWNACDDQAGALRERAETAEVERDYYRYLLDKFVEQRNNAELAVAAWEEEGLAPESALREIDAVIQSHDAVNFKRFKAGER